MPSTTIDAATLQYDAETELMEAIRQRNLAVGKNLPLAPYDVGLARARAALDRAVAMIEASGVPQPTPFAYRANLKPGDVRWRERA